MRYAIACTTCLALFAMACGAESADGGGRRHDPNRQSQYRIEQPMDDPSPPMPKETGGKGRGNETKWDRKINH